MTEFRYRLSKHGDRALRWIVWKMPRRLVMWASVRVILNATNGPYSDQVVPELLAMDALERWESL
jgi:hypothetical protein